MDNRMLTYYRNQNIVAVSYENNKLPLHFIQRENLLANHLKLPLLFFRGKEVLEFGPNGGENSLLLFLNEAKITLVEPDSNLHESILALYQNRGDLPGGGDNIKLLSHSIETFPRDNMNLYDYVIAEGFLHAIPSRIDLISKLMSLSRGFVVFTYSCPWGSFFEGLKRVILKKSVENRFQVNYVDSTLKQKMQVANDFFYQDFLELTTARTFDSWVKDVMLNPCQNSLTFDKFSDLIEVISAGRYEFYSSSPSWDERNLWEWYKKPSKEKICNEWKKNISFFISGKKSLSFSSHDIQLIPKLSGLFYDFSSDYGGVSFDEILSSANQLTVTFNEVNRALSFLTSGDYAGALQCYLSSQIMRLWGMPHHYLCIKKMSP